MSDIIDIVFDEENLHKAYKKASSSIKFKYNVQNYELNEFRQINEIREKYYSGKFEFKKGNEFNLHERGKVRRITTIPFQDRVVISSFCQNVLIPRIKKYLIYDNCASLKGKGVDMQRERFRVHLQKYYRKYNTNQGWILQGDFTKFFDNLIHEKLIDLICGKINENDIDFKLFLEKIFKQFEVDVSYMSNQEYKDCLNQVFDSLKYNKETCNELKTGEKIMRKSIGIGHEVSQICGVFYPTQIDNYIKIVKGCKFYGRYADDFYIIHQDKEFLTLMLDDITKIAKNMGIHINEKKTHIKRLDKTITFLKVRYDLTKTGKVIMRLHKDNFKRERIKLKKFSKMLSNNQIDYKTIEQQYKSWKGNVNKRRKDKNGKYYGKCIYSNRKSVEKMNKIYNELFIKDWRLRNGRNKRICKS